MPVRSQHRTERRGEPKGTAALALAAILLVASCPAARSPAAAPPGGRCIVIDSDAARGRRAPRHPEGWQETSLWDDLAALFLLHRDVFVIRGGHFEPCIPAGAVRKLLAAAMGRRGTR
jgi:hypothetical protein